MTTIQNPTEFAAHIASLTTKLEVHRACNELLEELANKHTVAGLSKTFTKYRTELKKIKNSSLMENISTTKGTISQHISVNLFALSDEQNLALAEERAKSKNKSLGFDEDGNIRDVNIPRIDITAVIQKALNLLSSNDYSELSCAILLLTGLRPIEQTLSQRYYQNFDEVIDRDMVALEGNRISFKGLSKKRNLDDVNNYFTRPCLVDSEVLVKHQKRFQTLTPWNQCSKENTIHQTIGRTFKKIFGDDLATLPSYDDSGKATKSNTYKARAFYACVLRASLIAKGMGEYQAMEYIQKSLAHDSVTETIKYLSKYDSSRFTNPIDLNLELNLYEVGKMLIKKQEVVEKTEITTEKLEPKETFFSSEKFLDGLTDELRIYFLQTLEETRDLTTALLSLVNTTQYKKVSEEISKTEKIDKTSVVDRIEEIYQGIVTHNEKQEKPEDCLFPSWGLVDKISKKVFNKTIAKVTFDIWEGNKTDDINQHLASIGIVSNERNALWNGKHHRKSIGSKIDNVVSIITNGGNTN